jgi:predicted nuclease with TOPRIM domain
MENQVNNLPENTNAGKSKAVVFLSFLIVILAVVLLVLGWMYHQKTKDSEEIQTMLTAEKDSITHNLKGLMVDYKTLETTNDSINQKLQSEQDRVKKLYSQIQSERNISYSKIKEYQRELGTLRTIMKDLLHDVDSLNAMNQVLIAENIKVKEEASTAKKTVKELEQKTEELNSQVEKGSMIKVRSVVAMAVSRKGNEVTRARRVEKIRVCFTLSENAIAKPGIRDAYVRILGPDQFILAKSESDLFDFQGEKIVFSAKREVDYQNQDIDLCIYYDNKGELVAGKYQATVYVDGNLVGSGEFMLK